MGGWIVTIGVPLVLSTQHKQEVLHLHNAVVGAVVRHNWKGERRSVSFVRWNVSLWLTRSSLPLKCTNARLNQEEEEPRAGTAVRSGSVLRSQRFQVQPLLINST